MNSTALRDKICLVTGGNGGLGQAIAAQLAATGATVIITCRSRERGEAARATVVAAGRNASVDLMLADLSAQHSISELVNAFRRNYNRLDVLIHTAAIFTNKRVVSADGLELMLTTNHLAPFLMTNLLLDPLKQSANGRVLTVTAPSTVPINFDDLQAETRFSALRVFGATKMANLLFTYELARRLAGTRITANAIHPGLVKSNLMAQAPLPIRVLPQIFAATPAQAAAPIVALAASPEFATVSGKFFKDRKPIASNAYSHDQAVQRQLWEVSTSLTGLT